jgi:MFS superfamily sulfate permease-like transporter
MRALISRSQELFTPSLTVALIGFLESIAISKAFARQNGYEVINGISQHANETI